MAKKKIGAKKLLAQRLTKLKNLQSKFEQLDEIAPREFLNSKFKVNGLKFKSKHEAQEYIKEYKTDILKKLGKTKTYQTFLQSKTKKAKNPIYEILIARYWERDKLEDEINDNEDIERVNGRNKETNLHSIHSLLDDYFSRITSSEAIGLEIDENGNSFLYIQETK